VGVFVIASPPKAGMAISTPLSLRGFLKGSRGNLVFASAFVIASLPKGGVAIRFLDCFVASLLAMTVEVIVIAMGSPMESPWQSRILDREN
jgi:hypothetical protein